MEYFYAFVSLASGLGALLLGFGIVSDFMQKKTSDRLAGLLRKSSKNPLAGVGIGALSTAMVQSSAVTTVMTVGMVNAGIMTLYQATAIIMGANIGSTLTAQLAALSAFDFVSVAAVLVFVGALIVISAGGETPKVSTASSQSKNSASQNGRVFESHKIKRESRRGLGFAIAGFGLVFMGLKFMSLSLEVFCKSPLITAALTTFDNPFVLIFVGILITALIQSSSAITSVIISMTGAGMVIGSGGNSILYLILGTNVGTCLTAIIASAGTSPNARRAALIHLIFNVLSVIVFLPLLLPWDGFMEQTLAKWFPSPEVQIAMFHTLSNIACTILFLPFCGGFVAISKWLIKDPPSLKSDTVKINT